MDMTIQVYETSVEKKIIRKISLVYAKSGLFLLLISIF